MAAPAEGFVDPAVYAVPLYIVSMIAEGALLRGRAHVGDRRVAGYERRDTVASLAMGIGSLLFAGAVQLATYAVSDALWQYRFFDLGNGPLAWALAALAWEFSFYWHHRWGHEVRILWASHVNHHSSQKFNFSTALRQEWTPFTNLLVYPPWVLLGMRPSHMALVGGLSLVYQFFLHTELVGKLPKPLEFVLNTPSHHRVHHASNAGYLDKNYGGALIVFDRLFGTFAEEKEQVVYGLTKNLESFNPWVIAWHEYLAVFRDIGRTKGLMKKFRVLTRMPPEAEFEG
jgi:sterol desaturase/sphingolipid hydroxylase (fatty acid hydroxylase superfamily)